MLFIEGKLVEFRSVDQQTGRKAQEDVIVLCRAAARYFSSCGKSRVLNTTLYDISFFVLRLISVRQRGK